MNLNITSCSKTSMIRFVLHLLKIEAQIIVQINVFYFYFIILLIISVYDKTFEITLKQYKLRDICNNCTLHKLCAK